MSKAEDKICAEQVSTTLVCMKPGRRYELEGNQIIQFKHADKTLHSGTTNEEVLEMLIHRTAILDEEFPCVENKVALINMRKALEILKSRAARVGQ